MEKYFAKNRSHCKCLTTPRPFLPTPLTPSFPGSLEKVKINRIPCIAETVQCTEVSVLRYLLHLKRQVIMAHHVEHLKSRDYLYTVYNKSHKMPRHHQTSVMYLEIIIIFKWDIIQAPIEGSSCVRLTPSLNDDSQ